jgi:endonuclease/exonuclease/phosphatase family metal-dependent hydrolase
MLHNVEALSGEPYFTGPTSLAGTGRDLLMIGSYNIHGCVGADMRYDVDRVARVILELRCDTVGLQEVDGQVDGGGSAVGGRAAAGNRMASQGLQLQQLAAATAMHPVVVAPTEAGEFHFSNANALLTRREVGQVRLHDLSYKAREPRSALDVELHAGGRIMRVIVTHLGLRPGERRYQVRKLLTVLREIPAEQGVVVLGDINEWLPIGRPLRWLHGLLGKPPWQRSFPVWAPVFALDRVWTRPLGALLGFTVHRSGEARKASDHYPVKAVVAPDVSRRVPPPG